MEDIRLTEFSLFLIYIGLPGIVSLYIIGSLTGIRPKSGLSQILAITVLSIISYSLTQMLDASINYLQTRSFHSDFSDFHSLARNHDVPTKQLIYTIGSAIFLSYLLSYVHKFKLINRIGHVIGSTKRYGDEDIWEYFHNAPDDIKNGGWVFIRDHKTQLSYYGFISTWSESEKERELILTEVSVYKSDTSDFLYDCARMYLCRRKDDLTIEVPSETNL